MTGYPAMGLDVVAQTRLGRIEAEAGALSFCSYDVRELADPPPRAFMPLGERGIPR